MSAASCELSVDFCQLSVAILQETNILFIVNITVICYGTNAGERISNHSTLVLYQLSVILTNFKLTLNSRLHYVNSPCLRPPTFSEITRMQCSSVRDLW